VNAVAVATPVALVVAIVVFVPLAKVPLAPVVGAVKVTLTPETGLLLASFTVTARRVPNALVTCADCGVVPLLAVICVGVPVLFVSEKETEGRPVAVAVALYAVELAIVFAVNAVAVATPLASVVALVVLVPLANLPLAPVVGAVNATLTPGTGLLLASFTVTASRVPKAVLMAADCGVVPAFAVICVGVPGVFVSAKLTEARPEAPATTL